MREIFSVGVMMSMRSAFADGVLDKFFFLK